MTSQDVTDNKTVKNNPLFATNYHIYINHTDAGGIVYHANHLVFFENCRRDWFTKIGLNGYFLQADDGQVQHFVVSQAELRYYKAIFLDEVISARIDKIELKPASIVFYQSLHRTTADSTTSVLSSGKIVVACVQNQVQSEPSASKQAIDTSIRPIRMPQKLRHLIEQAVMNANSSQ